MTSRFVVRLGVWTAPWLASACLSLSAAGSGAGGSLQELLAQLQHPHEPQARTRAAEAVAQYGERAVPSLRKLLHDAAPLVRDYACTALVRIGPRAEAAVPDLIAIAGNPGEPDYLRDTAVLALGQIGPSASSAVPVLCAALRENHPKLRRRLVSALAAIATPQAVAELVRLLEHGEAEEQHAVLTAFWERGVKSKHAAAGLLAVGARYPDRELSDRLFLTVATFGPEAADLLAPYLQADRIETRRQAALALSRLGPNAAVAVPALCETVEDEAEIVRFWAAKTLGNIGLEARQATGALLGLFGDADPNVRWEAVNAIAKIDLGAITEDDWSRLLADSDPGVRQRAATIRTAGL